jgi:hypothetical protein
MSEAIISIDPGASGAIIELQEGRIICHKLTSSMTETCDTIRSIAAVNVKTSAIVENVGGYMPGNSGPAAAKFARHIGHIEAALYLCAIPIVWNPTPQTWMKKIGVPPKMEKGDRKRYIKDWAARRYPTISVTLWNADALAMLASFRA